MDQSTPSKTWEQRMTSHVWPRGTPAKEDRYVMMGRLDNLPPSKSKVIRIFLSSTFTDMALERNALMKRSYPSLKTYCRDKYGMEFQVVDMRWGVRHMAADDHSTSDLCMKEIRNCQKVSMGPNFVAFIGQRYGTCCLPIRISNKELESIMECLTKARVNVDLLARTLENINDQHEKAWRFVDQKPSGEEDERAKAALQTLKTKIKEKNLPSSNYHEFTQQWSDDDGMNERDHEAYLEEFCQAFETSVKKLIDKALQKKTHIVPQDSLFAEVLEHAQQCVTKCERFHGREDILSEIETYIHSDEDKPLVIHGDSGFGKTSIMAKIVQQVPLWLGDEDKLGIVLRFLGTTPDTSTIVALLTSLCKQIIRIIGVTMRKKFPRLPDDIAELKGMFLDILQNIPTETRIVILLDSLDQLSTAYGAHTLNWLPLVLPSNVRLVVSTLPELVDQLETLLPEKPHCFIEVSQLDISTGLEIIRGWMKKLGRQLTDAQEAEVSSVLEYDARPLFVKLLFDDLANWKSYEVHRKLPKNVQNSIQSLFEALETKHGNTLVRRALGYISACKNGITETEIEDLLSMDDDVLNDVFQYHLPPERRLPSVLWARIRNDISEYIVDREADDSKVLGWYHRQFVQEAADRYFTHDKYSRWQTKRKKQKEKDSETDKQQILTNLLEYFLGKWGGGKRKPFKYTERHMQKLNLSDPNGEADRYLPEQPTVFNSGRGGKGVAYNRRKISELPHVLGIMHSLSDMTNIFLKDVFFTIEMLMGWIGNTPWSDVTQQIDDFTTDNSHDVDDVTREWIRAATIIQRSLLLSLVTVHQDATALANVLNGRLLMYYGVMKHFTDFTNLLDCHSPKYCSLVAPHAQLETAGGELLFVINNHSGPVRDMIFFREEDFVISVSRKMVAINMEHGEMAFDVYPRGVPSEDKPFDFLTASEELIAAAVSSPPILCVFDPEKGGDVSQVVNIGELLKRKSFVIKGIDLYYESEINQVFFRGDNVVGSVNTKSGKLGFSIVTEQKKGPVVQMTVQYERIIVVYEGGECAFFEFDEKFDEKKPELKGTLHLSNSEVIAWTPVMGEWLGMAFADNTLKFLHLERCVAEIAEEELPSEKEPSVLTTTSAPGRVHHISTEQSGDTYFVVSSSQHVTVYEIVCPEEKEVLEKKYQLKKKCTAAQLSRGLKLLFIYYGGTIEVFVVHRSGKGVKQLLLLDAHSQPVNKLIMSEMDGLFMSCSDDGAVKMWNVDSAEKTKDLIPRFHRAAATIEAIYQVGDAVMTTSYEPLEPCLIWSRLSGDVTQTFEHPQEKALLAAYLAPDGRHAMAVDSLGQALFWDVEASGEPIEINIVPLLEATIISRHPHTSIMRGMGLLVAEADGDCHVISCLKQSKSSFKLKTPETNADLHFCHWAVVQDTYIVAMTTDPSVLSVYDLSKNAGRTIILPDTSGKVLHLKTTHSGAEVCVLCDTLVFVDVAEGEVKANVTLARPAESIHGDEVGKALLVVGEERCLLIGLRTYAVEHEFVLYKGQPDDTLQCLSPDGNYFLYVTDRKFLSITRMDGTHLGTYPAHDSIHCMAISDDSCYVMIATSDRRLLFLLIVDPDVPEHAQRIKHARSNNKSMDADKCSQLVQIIENPDYSSDEEFLMGDWELDHDILESPRSRSRRSRMQSTWASSNPKTQAVTAFDKGKDRVDLVTENICTLQ